MSSSSTPMMTRAKRKPSQTSLSSPSSGSDESPDGLVKRPRLQALRKFAEGVPLPRRSTRTYSPEPVDLDEDEEESAEGVESPTSSGNTSDCDEDEEDNEVHPPAADDFFSWLCFRGTTLMTSELEIFDNPSIYVEEPVVPQPVAAPTSRLSRGASPLITAEKLSRRTSTNSGVSTPRSGSSRSNGSGLEKTTKVLKAVKRSLDKVFKKKTKPGNQRSLPSKKPSVLSPLARESLVVIQPGAVRKSGTPVVIPRYIKNRGVLSPPKSASTVTDVNSAPDPATSPIRSPRRTAEQATSSAAKVIAQRKLKAAKNLAKSSSLGSSSPKNAGVPSTGFASGLRKASRLLSRVNTSNAEKTKLSPNVSPAADAKSPVLERRMSPRGEPTSNVVQRLHGSPKKRKAAQGSSPPSSPVSDRESRLKRRAEELKQLTKEKRMESSKTPPQSPTSQQKTTNKVVKGPVRSPASGSAKKREAVVRTRRQVGLSPRGSDRSGEESESMESETESDSSVTRSKAKKLKVDEGAVEDKSSPARKRSEEISTLIAENPTITRLKREGRLLERRKSEPSLTLERDPSPVDKSSSNRSASGQKLNEEPSKNPPKPARRSLSNEGNESKKPGTSAASLTRSVSSVELSEVGSGNNGRRQSGKSEAESDAGSSSVSSSSTSRSSTPISQRPSRRSKEASSSYMQLFLSRLSAPDDDMDEISLTEVGGEYNNFERIRPTVCNEERAEERRETEPPATERTGEKEQPASSAVVQNPGEPTPKATEKEVADEAVKPGPSPKTTEKTKPEGKAAKRAASPRTATPKEKAARVQKRTKGANMPRTAVAPEDTSEEPKKVNTNKKSENEKAKPVAKKAKPGTPQKAAVACEEAPGKNQTPILEKQTGQPEEKKAKPATSPRVAPAPEKLSEDQKKQNEIRSSEKEKTKPGVNKAKRGTSPRTNSVPEKIPERQDEQDGADQLQKEKPKPEAKKTKRGTSPRAAPVPGKSPEDLTKQNENQHLEKEKEKPEVNKAKCGTSFKAPAPAGEPGEGLKSQKESKNVQKEKQPVKKTPQVAPAKRKEVKTPKQVGNTAGSAKGNLPQLEKGSKPVRLGAEDGLPPLPSSPQQAVKEPLAAPAASKPSSSESKPAETTPFIPSFIFDSSSGSDSSPPPSPPETTPKPPPTSKSRKQKLKSRVSAFVEELKNSPKPFLDIAESTVKDKRREEDLKRAKEELIQSMNKELFDKKKWRKMKPKASKKAPNPPKKEQTKKESNVQSEVVLRPGGSSALAEGVDSKATPRTSSSSVDVYEFEDAPSSPLIAPKPLKSSVSPTGNKAEAVQVSTPASDLPGPSTESTPPGKPSKQEPAKKPRFFQSRGSLSGNKAVVESGVLHGGEAKGSASKVKQGALAKKGETKKMEKKALDLKRYIVVVAEAPKAPGAGVPAKAPKKPNTKDSKKQVTSAVPKEPLPTTSKSVQETPAGTTKISATQSSSSAPKPAGIPTPVRLPTQQTRSSALTLSQAPVYRPTSQEFADPLEFIAKITPEAAKFGMCQIVPPADFKPECSIQDDMRFMAYHQYVHKMFRRWNEASKKVAAMAKILKKNNVEMTRNPWLGGVDVDLSALHDVVECYGGLTQVMSSRLWSKVADAVHIPAHTACRADKLEEIYCKYVLPYAALNSEEREELFKEVEADHNEKVKALGEENVKFAEDPFNAKKDGDGKDDDDEESDEEDESLECVVEGKNMPLNQFFRYSRNLYRMRFNDRPVVGKPASGNASSSRNPPITVDDIEADYWQVVKGDSGYVCSLTGSMDSGPKGQYGFPPPHKSGQISKHPWNLKVLTKNPSSLLRCIGQVVGMTMPTIHFGMLFSTCCWYRDPHGLPWIEYMHTGTPKIWYSIPSRAEEQFRSAMLKMMPEFCHAACPIWLPADTAMIPFKDLLDCGVPVSRTVQEPGSFVVIFPKSFASSICTSYTVSESVMFAPEGWLSICMDAFSRLECSKEEPSFSIERFLCNVSEDAKVGPKVLSQVLSKLEAVISEEKQARQALEDLKVPFAFPDEKKTKELADQSSPSPSKKANKRRSKNDEEEEIPEEMECELCSKKNFFSWAVVQSEDENIYYCLKHAYDYMTKHSAKERSEESLEIFIKKTKEEMREYINRTKKRIMQLSRSK